MSSSTEYETNVQGRQFTKAAKEKEAEHKALESKTRVLITSPVHSGTTPMSRGGEVLVEAWECHPSTIPP